MIYSIFEQFQNFKIQNQNSKFNLKTHRKKPLDDYVPSDLALQSTVGAQTAASMDQYLQNDRNWSWMCFWPQEAWLASRYEREWRRRQVQATNARLINSPLLTTFRIELRAIALPTWPDNHDWYYDKLKLALLANTGPLTRIRITNWHRTDL